MSEINAPKSKTTGIPGWHTEAEEDALIALARRAVSQQKSGVIVELGGEYGRSAAEFAWATQGFDYQIITIDQFPTNHPVVGDLLATYTRHLKAAGLFDRVITYRSDSSAFAPRMQDASLDILLIDAAHDYNGVKRDIEAWWSKVKPGGVIIFHDYANEHGGQKHHYSHYEVKQAVDEWHKQHPDWLRQAGPDSLIWFIRPEGKQTTVPERLPEPPELMTVAQICAEFGLSRSTFNRSYKDRLTVAKTEGRTNYYQRSEVVKSLE